MPKYVTIGYGDRAGYEKTPEDLRAAAHAQDNTPQPNGGDLQPAVSQRSLLHRVLISPFSNA
jgi:hypothetical protein